MNEKYDEVLEKLVQKAKAKKQKTSKYHDMAEEFIRVIKEGKPDDVAEWLQGFARSVKHGEEQDSPSVTDGDSE
jgi:hypothetical protein